MRSAVRVDRGDFRVFFSFRCAASEVQSAKSPFTGDSRYWSDIRSGVQRATGFNTGRWGARAYARRAICWTAAFKPAVRRACTNAGDRAI